MRQYAQDTTRLRLANPARALSLFVYTDVVLAHLAEHFVAEIVRDMPGTEQAKWMASNESNQRVEIEARLRLSKADLILTLHARGLEPIDAAKAVVASQC